MEITTTYSELERIIKNKSGNSIKLIFVDSNIIRIDYTIQIMKSECQKSINFRLLSIEDNAISVDFVDQDVTNTVIGILNHFVPIDFIEVDYNNCIIKINTNQINQLQEIYKVASLGHVYFEDGSVCLKINLK